MNYTSPIYQPSRAVTFLQGIPRFGKLESLPTNDDEASDYVIGLLFLPILVFAITMLWLIMLAVFKCTCRNSFLSGRGPYDKGSPIESPTIRILFIIFASIVLAFSIIFFRFGDDLSSKAVNSIERPKDDLFGEIQNVTDVLGNILNIAAKTITTNNDISDNINRGVCIDLPEDVKNLLDDISNEIDTSDYTKEIDQLEDLKGSFQNTLDETEADVDDLFVRIEDIIGYVQYASIPFLSVSAVLGCWAILTWVGLKSRVYTLIQTFFILPLFVILQFIASLLTALIGVILLVFSDVCTGGEEESPEGTLKTFLDSQLNDEEDEKTRNLIDYYIIEGCRGESPNGEIEEISDSFFEIKLDIDEAIETTREFFEGVCKEESSELDGLLQTAQSNLNDLDFEVQRGLNSVSCKTINSIYVDVAHEGMCGSVADGLFWIFWFFMIVCAGGLLMLTTRSAIQPSRNRVSDETKEKETQLKSVAMY